MEQYFIFVHIFSLLIVLALGFFVWLYNGDVKRKEQQLDIVVPSGIKALMGVNIVLIVTTNLVITLFILATLL